MAAERLGLLARWLEEVAAKIRELESQARIVIEEQGDQKGYEALMREKALLLAGLGEEAAERLEGAGGAEVERVLARLERFSSSAAMALDVGSVFFMSALLYPEDYVAGDNNDLENFILSVRVASAGE
ncbi:hypothetical protein [Paucidesulfovibrio longus]|uniref:hypothetical protein n=1 Tax=Paucidesulfovibrio longus TaxID=889 RepID=UPI0003B66A17|nr:hypothetical protein [Paucidesulfovibrio longus]